MLASEVNKLQTIKAYEHANIEESWSIYSAFVACLTPEESCAALELDLEQHWRNRRVILKKILKDIEGEFQPCHQKLINDLKSVYATVSYKQKRTCGYHLSLLCETIPVDFQLEIIKFILESKYVAIRGSGYKRLRILLRSVPSCPLSWIPINFDDIYSVQIIIDYFPEEYIEHNLEKFQEKVSGTNYLA